MCNLYLLLDICYYTLLKEVVNCFDIVVVFCQKSTCILFLHTVQTT